MPSALTALAAARDTPSPPSRATSPSPPPPSYGATDCDLEANNVSVAKPVQLSSPPPPPSSSSAEAVRMEPAWMAWRRERMLVLGPVQQDKRVLLWAWTLLCVFAVVLGLGLGLAYGRRNAPGAGSD